MFFTHFALALIVAVLLTLAFASVGGGRRPWSGMLTFLLIILLASWSGGIWISPFGPVLWGATWLPFLLSGLVVALVFLAAEMPERQETTVELVDPKRRRQERRGARIVLNVLLSVLVLILLVSIGLRYLQAI